MASEKKTKKECPYGMKCHETNFPHLNNNLMHSHLDKYLKSDPEKIDFPRNFVCEKSVYIEQLKILTSGDSPPEVITPAQTMAEKLKMTHPYNLFCNVIPAIPETAKQGNSISFRELLCPSLGKLKKCLLVTNKVEVTWLMEEFSSCGLGDLPITLLWDDSVKHSGMEYGGDSENYLDGHFSNVTYGHLKPVGRDGHHHPKFAIFLYEDDSLRIAVFTMNHCYEDWNDWINQVWISPLCPKFEKSNKAGESPTNFKANFVTYLKTYRLPCLGEWIENAEIANFSAVKVVFIPSIPGNYGSKLLLEMNKQLNMHCKLPESDSGSAWKILVQPSCLGFFGKTPDEWLFSLILKNLSKHTRKSNDNPEIKIVFPSENNAKQATRKDIGNRSSNPYSKSLYEAHHDESQQWLKKYLYQWRADKLARSEAMPHCKSYCRVSEDDTKMSWYLLTTANLTRSSWGKITRGGSFFVNNQEIGILFLPKFFSEEYFDVGENGTFPLIYDLPLTGYDIDDLPYAPKD